MRMTSGVPARLPAIRGSLTPTALYTSGCWAWARMPGAELLAHRGALRVFRSVNGALALARIFRPRAPSLRHSLVQRHVMIDRLVDESGGAHVLELAAGLSARGVRRSADPDITYVEVDQAEVIALKRSLLERSEAGRAALARPNLQLCARDLAREPIAGLAPPPPAPLLVIAEGLLMYLDAGAQARLFAQVRAALDGRRGTFVFDLVPAVEQPRPGLPGRVLGWLFRRLTRGGRFAVDDRGREDIVAALRAAGFAHVDLLEPATAPAAWNLPHLERRTQQLLFVARTD